MTTPTIIATGLACLDVMDDRSGYPPQLTAGGFPNALILLCQRGWNSIPIAVLGLDRAGDYLMQEFLDWKLDTRFIDRRVNVHTPIYILYHRNGGHYFGKECPGCHTPFPPYEPVQPGYIAVIRDSLPKTIDVCYFDKVSPAALDLAALCRERSARVMFEPNRIENEDLFRRSVAVSDIVKYSRERRDRIQDFTDAIPVPLEIETAGAEGLYYRIARQGESREWRFLPACQVSNFVDAAGAGDWLTTTLLATLVPGNSFEAQLNCLDRIEEILRMGQQASAYNCQFAGARGALYTDRRLLRGNDYCPYCMGKPVEKK